ncbi:MAG: heat-inducible transcription repressor HrcA [Acidimicrobiia bacterium]|nr:MAG: heat-inducible transcription repressor HrcA [Acidimicrobiia bacterium]
MEGRSTDRRHEILRALVEEHIRTGEPVSSRAILEATDLGVSSATIRNELAALEREGYCVQPHTSAGRIPTAKAYRYYVDHVSPTRLGGSTRQRIARFFSSVQLELGRLLKATTELLSEITHYPSVAVGPGPVGERVKAVHLVQIGAKSVLLVAVTESGRVVQELCRLDRSITPSELEEAERILARATVGLDFGQATSVEIPLAELAPEVRETVSVAREALTRAARGTAEIYVGGTRQMATVWDNLATVHRVLEVLEREATLLDILARAPGTTIQLADELDMDEGLDLAVVSSSFEAGSSEGRVGVIGPMRMDYRRVISAVESVSRELGERIGS